MSYDIELIDQKTGQVALLENASFIRGGTIPAEYDKDLECFKQVSQTEASINITYNYSHYYYEATEGIKDFAHEENGGVSYGIRGLYGKTGYQSVSMLQRMIADIEANYQDCDGKWLESKREKTYFYDENGKEVDMFITYLKGDKSYKKEIKEYIISEGDTSNYWEHTAANAIIPLKDMLHMAIECPDAVWEGD